MKTILRRRVFAGLFTGLLLFLSGCDDKSLTQEQIDKMEKSKFEDLQNMIRKRAGLLAATDDEPVTMAGGSLKIFLGGHKWTKTADVRWDHPRKSVVVRSVEVRDEQGMNSYREYARHDGRSAWNIRVTYRDGNDSFYSFHTAPDGTGLYLVSEGDNLRTWLNFPDSYMEHGRASGKLSAIRINAGTGGLYPAHCPSGQCEVGSNGKAMLVLHMCESPGTDPNTLCNP